MGAPDSAAPKKALSSKLQQMRFMQRRVEQRKAETETRDKAAEAADTDAPKHVPVKQEEPANPEHWHTEAAASTARCRVIQEGDPQPGLAGGRMQFSGSSASAEDPQIEKLAELQQQAPSSHMDRFFSPDLPRQHPGPASPTAKRKHAAGYSAAPQPKQHKAGRP